MNSKILITLLIALCLFTLTTASSKAALKQAELIKSMKTLNKMAIKTADGEMPSFMTGFNFNEFSETNEETEEYDYTCGFDDAENLPNWYNFNWELVKGWDTVTPGNWWTPAIADDSEYLKSCSGEEDSGEENPEPQ